MVDPIPKEYHSVTPYLYLKGAAKAIDFYKEALGAEEITRHAAPDGTIVHAEIQIGDARVMLVDEHPDMDVLGPETRGGATCAFLIYLEDVDAAFDRAIAAGGTEFRPVMDQFYGDRSGTFIDPFGQVWTLSTHIEDITEEEMERRMAEMQDDSGTIEIDAG